jgi:nicotinamide-nucleotide amidase
MGVGEGARAHPLLAPVFARGEPRERLLLRTFGIGESHVGDLFAAAGGDPPGVETSICARNYEIEIDIRARAGAEGAAATLRDRLATALGEHVFARDERPLAAIVVEALRARGWTAATAESCTAGLVAAALTEVPGSSDVVAGGIVAYSNEAKERLLGVDAGILARHGAVSAETARAMAAGGRRALGADAAVAVTGVAGPGGGTPEKPVGTVCVCVADGAGSTLLERNVRVPGDRAAVRERTTTLAMHLLRRAVLGTVSSAA